MQLFDRHLRQLLKQHGRQPSGWTVCSIVLWHRLKMYDELPDKR